MADERYGSSPGGDSAVSGMSADRSTFDRPLSAGIDSTEYPQGSDLSTSPMQQGQSQSQSGQSQLGQTARDTMEEAKRHAADVAGTAKEQGRRLFEGQKQSAVGQVDSVASALRRTAEQLQQEDQSETGRYLSMAAERLQNVGQQFRDKDLDTLLRDAQDFGRRSPAALFVGSVAVGFLLARFLKASNQRQAGDYGYDQGRQSYADPAFAARPSEGGARDTGLYDDPSFGAGSSTPGMRDQTTGDSYVY